jgi:thioesterase domain-containing protein
MPGTPELSDAKRALLEKYLRGERPQGAAAAGGSAVRGQDRARPASASDARVSLIPVQPGGSRRPLFYLHVHWIGGAFYSFALARTLGADQPLSVIDPYRFDGLRVPPSIEAMAAAYIEAIRAVQPEGPYRLGGFCAGGLLAYEIAQQLRAVGQAVDVLILIDPMAGQIRFLRMLGSVIRRLGAVLRLGPGKQVDWFLRVRYVSRVVRRSRDENTEHVDRLMQQWRDEHPQRVSLIPAADALRQDWMALFVWAVSGYVPHSYPGKMTYLFAQDNPDGRHLWWGTPHETARVEIRVIPGTHETCRTEHLHALADQLSGCLRALPS